MSTVYILGAGASASFDRSYTGLQCPSSKNFFSVAYRVIESKSEESFNNYGNIIFFLEKYFNLSFDRLEKVGLDMQDVLTFLDLELEYSESDREVELLQKARNEFMDLIAITFNNVLKGPPCPYHAALASSLKKGDTVISFNYDLLIDSALLENCRHWHPENGYGFNALLSAGAYNSPAPSSGVYLFKPHGSFNWIGCKTCGKIYVLPLSQSEFPVRLGRLHPVLNEPPGHNLQRMIIPPSLKKDVHGKIMQQIWLSAGSVLERARQIVIIGYSLPATDFLVKRLFYRSLSHNRNLYRLDLVDRNNGGTSPNLLGKYRPILYGVKRRVKIVHDKKNLKEYIKAFKDKKMWN